MTEKRKERRAPAIATASAFRSGRLVGVYLVQNLSAGGALLVDGPVLAPGTTLRLMVRLVAASAIEVSAVVLRHEASSEGLANIAVAFQHEHPGVEEAIRNSVLKVLACEHDRAILIVHRLSEDLITLAESAFKLGYRPLLASTPLEAMRWICRENKPIDAALIDAGLQNHGDAALLRFLREDFPHVRRILIHEAEFSATASAIIGSSDAQATLHSPWTTAGIDAALKQGRVAELMPPEPLQ